MRRIMSQDNRTSNLFIIDLSGRSTSVQNEDTVKRKHAKQWRQPIILDPQRPGDRQRLVRILAQIAWRLAKEQAVQDVVSSQAQ
jgi:hypothetical protein